MKKVAARYRDAIRLSIFLFIVLSMILAGCDKKLASRRRSSATPPLDCLILNLFPYSEDIDRSYFESLHTFIEKTTGWSVNFRYMSRRDFNSGNDPDDTMRRVFVEEIESASPPDIILNPAPDLFLGTDLLDDKADLLSDVSELSIRAAPGIYAYVSRRAVKGISEKPVIIPMIEQIPGVDLWLVRSEFLPEPGNGEIATTRDMIDLLSSLKADGVYEYPGACYSGSPTIFVELLYPELYCSIGEVRNNGIYREPNGTRALTIFDEYPADLRDACEYAYKTIDEMLFSFKANTAEAFDQRLLDGDWAAAWIPLNLTESFDLERLFARDPGRSLVPVRVDAGELIASFRWPPDVGIIIPANSGRAEDAMRFLEAINTPELIEAAYYGVPGKHYRRTGDDTYKRLVREPRFHDFTGNPFLFMALGDPPLLFEQHIPQTLREIFADYHNAVSTAADDPLEGFALDVSGIEEAYKRYQTVHKQTFNQLIRSKPEDFDIRYADFRAQAEADYRTIRTEMQRQIDRFIE